MASANVGRAQMLFKLSFKFTQIMYIHLIRNQPKGSAITGRLIINGRFFCNTLERKGYEIPALCYPVRVTMSPRFKRLLPIVQNVPQRSGIRIHRGSKPEHSSGCVLVVGDNNNNSNNINQQLLQSTPFAHEAHRGPRRSQQHSERSREYNSSPLGCVLISHSFERLFVPQRNVVENEVVDVVVNKNNISSRSAADVEIQLTQLLLQTQESHEEIILEVIDFHPGTEYGYNTPCPPELQKP